MMSAPRKLGISDTVKSPCGERNSQPPLSSVAGIEEVEIENE
jgi:hypothetical protein